MQTAKEYREQLEWFWLFCQEEAWQEERRTDWQVILTTTNIPAGTDGRYYYTVKVVETNMHSEGAAKAYADDLNSLVAGPDEYYSIRKVEY